MNSFNKLPDLASEKPTFSIDIPTTGEKTEYQSYTKDEEKAILIALEEKDYATIISTLQNILSSHCRTELTTVVDFIYLLFHIRAKSHGGHYSFTIKSDECGNENININVENVLDHIRIKNKDVLHKTYQVRDNISLRLSPTKIDLLKHIKINDSAENAFDMIDNMILYSIDYVVYNEQIIKDFTLEQLKEKIVDHLSPLQVQEINEMIGDMINICFEVKYHCKKCNKEHVKEISDFL